MPHAWIVDDEHPDGHAVPMLPAELAKLDQDLALAADAVRESKTMLATRPPGDQCFLEILAELERHLPITHLDA